MKEMIKLKDFDTYVAGLNESRTQKKTTVAAAVDKIKERYGENPSDFLAVVQKVGGDKVKETDEPRNRRVQRNSENCNEPISPMNP